MQFAKRFVLTLMAVLALGAIATATASAEETEKTRILPLPTTTEPLKVTSTSEKGTLLTVGGSQVTCEKDTATSSFTTGNLGTFDVLFEECKTKIGLLSGVCTGETDTTSGSILLLGEVHYVLGLWMINANETKLVAVLAFLIKELHFTCVVGGVNALVIVKGCAPSLAESEGGELEKLSKLTKDKFEEWKSGETRILEILMENDKEGEIHCLTETNVNGKGFELSAETGSVDNTKFTKNGKAVEVLLMDK